MSKLETDLFPERLPVEVMKDLRVKLEEMEKGFSHEKNAEACAMAIQRLQKEFKMAKDFHIKLAPKPCKLTVVK